MYKINIISGIWRGKKISFYKNANVKPTLGIIRETLFNWLMPIINNAKCLDCFSGSGILGLESISRNAKYVVMLEKNFNVGKNIIKNIKMLKTNKAKIIITDTLTWLLKKRISFDIIFLDPPFKQELVNKAVFLLNKNEYVKNGSLIYIETEINNFNLNIPSNWKLFRKKNTKRILYRLYYVK